MSRGHLDCRSAPVERAYALWLQSELRDASWQSHSSTYSLPLGKCGVLKKAGNAKLQEWNTRFWDAPRVPVKFTCGAKQAAAIVQDARSTTDRPLKRPPRSCLANSLAFPEGCYATRDCDPRFKVPCDDPWAQWSCSNKQTFGY